MQRELEKRLMKIVMETSDTMTEETGVMPSMSEVQMKEYLDKVVAEINAENKNK
jgi:hypothetical protein